MVYIKNWTDFETATTDLYARSPSKVRYCVKFVPKSGELVLKVTDDIKCIKYKSHSSIILNRFESLNLRLLTQMTNTKVKRIPVSSTTIGGGGLGATIIDTPERGGTPLPDEVAVTAASAAASTTIAGGDKTQSAPGQGKSSTGGKKKKKGKK
ncbi:uncharacterized protein IL334_006077 [Kwoniella shivajii]|uniref:SRP9 domain-containing protein n=1 Tax=Kwoniella shivajii TaxID=564305 RepID=A0ABZ1D700_9TREE|nr:hypothetical protein IL334_006077 [Kwoniella shivajii]